MKVLGLSKRAANCGAKLRVKSDGIGADIANAKVSMNPFDETVTFCGVTQYQEALGTARAIGTDSHLGQGH